MFSKKDAKSEYFGCNNLFTQAHLLFNDSLKLYYAFRMHFSNSSQYIFIQYICNTNLDVLRKIKITKFLRKIKKFMDIYFCKVYNIEL